MADSKFVSQQNNGCGGFKEAVCINAGRIYDSCSDKDCLEDLQVYFTPLNQAIVDNALSVKCKCIQVYTCFLEVEPVPFNKGFYSVDMAFYFVVKLDAIVSPLTPAVSVSGLSVFTKKVILYGSEGSVNTFTSDRIKTISAHDCCDNENLPRASLSVAAPVCLSCKICDIADSTKPVSFSCPAVVAKAFEDEFDMCYPKKAVCVSLGLFSIVQLEREVQMMVPVYDYCVPDKECVSSTDDPCEMFKKIKFPVNEFFPPKLGECPIQDDRC